VLLHLDTVFVLVAFLSCRLNPSNELVVYIILLISSENLKKVDSLSQLLYQESITIEYFLFHLSFKSSSAATAASSLEALHTLFNFRFIIYIWNCYFFHLMLLLKFYKNIIPYLPPQYAERTVPRFVFTQILKQSLNLVLSFYLLLESKLLVLSFYLLLESKLLVLSFYLLLKSKLLLLNYYLLSIIY